MLPDVEGKKEKVKIAIHRDNGGWVVDDIAKDYARFTRHKVVSYKEADLIWCLNFWGYEELRTFKAPKVVTIHHLVPEKGGSYSSLFKQVNASAKAVLVPNKITQGQLAGTIKVPVTQLPYWLLSSRMAQRIDTEAAKKEMCPNGEILIGSFQKDSNTKSDKAKFEKNPQLFVDICEALKQRGHKIKVLLTGFSRRYVIRELTAREIPVIESLRTSNDLLNAAYDTIDWYFVTSRYEGGPQAVLECGYRKVKILSTSVGMAPWVLEKACWADTVEDFVQKFESDCDYREQNFSRVAENFIPQLVVPRYDNFFEGVIGA
jgi:glycosyltransferase involved in cell wall biosynthesis